MSIEALCNAAIIYANNIIQDGHTIRLVSHEEKDQDTGEILDRVMETREAQHTFVNYVKDSLLTSSVPIPSSPSSIQ